MATLKNTRINDTGFLEIPAGTTAQRPSSPVKGMYRFNTDKKLTEYYNGSSWIAGEAFQEEVLVPDINYYSDPGWNSSEAIAAWSESGEDVNRYATRIDLAGGVSGTYPSWNYYSTTITTTISASLMQTDRLYRLTGICTYKSNLYTRSKIVLSNAGYRSTNILYFFSTGTNSMLFTSKGSNITVAVTCEHDGSQPQGGYMGFSEIYVELV